MSLRSRADHIYQHRLPRIPRPNLARAGQLTVKIELSRMRDARRPRQRTATTDRLRDLQDDAGNTRRNDLKHARPRPAIMGSTSSRVHGKCGSPTRPNSNSRSSTGLSWRINTSPSIVTQHRQARPRIPHEHLSLGAMQRRREEQCVVTACICQPSTMTDFHGVESW